MKTPLLLIHSARGESAIHQRLIPEAVAGRLRQRMMDGA
jgi:hypothetical protein